MFCSLCYLTNSVGSFVAVFLLFFCLYSAASESLVWFPFLWTPPARDNCRHRWWGLICFAAIKWNWVLFRETDEGGKGVVDKRRKKTAVLLLDLPFTPPCPQVSSTQGTSFTDYWQPPSISLLSWPTLTPASPGTPLSFTLTMVCQDCQWRRFASLWIHFFSCRMLASYPWNPPKAMDKHNDD